MTEKSKWSQEQQEFYMDTQTHVQTLQNSTQNTYTRFVTSGLSGFENMQGYGIFSESVSQLLLREEFITLI